MLIILKNAIIIQPSEELEPDPILLHRGGTTVNSLELTFRQFVQTTKISVGQRNVTAYDFREDRPIAQWKSERQ